MQVPVAIPNALQKAGLPCEYGKLATMNATVEIDKLGRLVVPKKMREALHLRPGDQLDAHVSGDQITLEPKRTARGLHKRDGRLVFDGGEGLSPDINDLIDTQRRQRSDYLLGFREEP